MTKTIWTGLFTAFVGVATAAMSAQAPATPQSNTSSADRNDNRDRVLEGSAARKCSRRCSNWHRGDDRYSRNRWDSRNGRNGRDDWRNREPGGGTEVPVDERSRGPGRRRRCSHHPRNDAAARRSEPIRDSDTID